MLTYSPPTLTHWLCGPCGIELGPGQGRLMPSLEMNYVFDAYLKLMNAAFLVRTLFSYPMVYRVANLNHLSIYLDLIWVPPPYQCC